jgi:hypothetical protein
MKGPMKTCAAFALATVLAATLACAGAPSYDYAFDPAFRFTTPKTYAWYDDPNFKPPGGGAIVDGRFVDENIRRAIDETLQKKGVQPAAAGATPDIYVSYSTRAEGASSQDRVSSYSWWSGLYETSTKYRQGGTLWISIRDSQQKLIWRGLKSALLGTSPDALRGDINRAVSELLAEYPPPPGAKNAAAP